MTTFLIIVAILVLLTIIICSLSAEISIIYDKKLDAKVKFLFIEKELDLDAILTKLIKVKDKTENIATDDETVQNEPESSDNQTATNDVPANNDTAPAPAKKPNIIKQIYDKDGVLGILLMVSNLLQTLNSTLITFFKGFHIRSFCVKMIIGGGDAAQIGIDYGKICGAYFPLKGFILSNFKVDNCDDYIAPDFIAPYSEYEFQLIMTYSVGAVFKVVGVAIKTFLQNLIKNR